MVAKSKPEGQSPLDQPVQKSERGRKANVDPIAARMAESSAPLPGTVGAERSGTVMRTTVVGAFAERTHAQEAVSELRRAGFQEDEIGLIARDQTRGALGAHEVQRLETSEGEGVTEGAVAGSLTGAGLAGLWAIGISAGIMPAIGPAIAGGILASLLTSAVAGAAVGGVLGSLVGLGLSEDEARHYEQAFHTGHTIVTVRSPGRVEEAAHIMERFGAVTDSPSVQGVSDMGEPSVPVL